MEKFDRIYLFDDCDSIDICGWEDRDSRLKDALLLLYELFQKESDRGALITDNCDLWAWLGNAQYTVNNSSGEKKVEKVDSRWMESQDSFNKTIADVMADAHKKRVLFLFDWSLSALAWVQDQPHNCVLLLDELFAHRNELDGVAVCYTTIIEDPPIQQEFPVQERRFSEAGDKLRLMRLLWRWKDIPSTEYNLYQKLCNLLDI